MSALLSGHRAFAARGNGVDMAAGIVGAAFGRIVGALVADAVMPPIGLLVGNIVFGNLFVNLSSAPVASLGQARGAGIRAVAKPPGGFFIRMCRHMPAPGIYPQARWSIRWRLYSQTVWRSVSMAALRQ
jgi:hypothetical protein